MDLLIRLKDLFISMVYNLPESLTSLVLRMGVLLVLTTILLVLACLYLPWRSVFTQTCVAFISIVVSLYVPVEEFREVGEGFLAFVVAFALLCMIFLPNWLPFWLTPRLGNQLKLKRIVRYVIWGLFLMQMFVR